MTSFTGTAVESAPATQAVETTPVTNGGERKFTVLGVSITDATVERAIELMRERMLRRQADAAAISIVNAHTLNLASADPDYRAVLNASDFVFGDGTGVRWAARLQGLRLQANLVGTDLLPRYFAALAGQGHSYYLLGASPESLPRAVDHARREFAGWDLAGYHHGYLQKTGICRAAVEDINRVRPDLVLVAMGNPVQESWIARHRHELDAGLCVGVGGLFDLWAGNLQRPPRFFRDRGCEWLGILLQQPHKARRYLLGNPLFLARILRDRLGRGSRQRP